MSAEGLGNYFSQQGTIALENIQTDPPTENGGSNVDVMFVNEAPYLRDRDAIKHPLVVGADGAGVYSIALADSPFDVPEDARVLLVDTTDGAVTARLPADGGPFDGRPLAALDAKTKFGTNAFTLDGNGKTINGAATVVLSTDDASVAVVYGGVEWGIQAAASGPSGLVAHAPTHRASGSDDLLSAPGPIGGTTPDTGAFTSIALDFNAAQPAPAVGYTQLAAGNVAPANGLTIIAPLGARLSVANGGSATADVWAAFVPETIANNAVVSIATGGHGGMLLLAVVGASGASIGLFGVANDGTTTLGGLTPAGLALTAANPGTVNVYKSAANTVGIENKTGGAVTVLRFFSQAVAV